MGDFEMRERSPDTTFIRQTLTIIAFAGMFLCGMMFGQIIRTDTDTATAESAQVYADQIEYRAESLAYRTLVNRAVGARILTKIDLSPPVRIEGRHFSDVIWLSTNK